MLPTSIEITLFGKAYTVKFPNAGQFIDVEVKKALLSQNQYNRLNNMRTNGADTALSLIEATAYFSILIPQLEEDLNGFKNLFELSMIEIKPMLKAYRETFVPWYAQWLDILKDDATDSDS
jgi:hypothetical protein